MATSENTEIPGNGSAGRVVREDMIMESTPMAFMRGGFGEDFSVSVVEVSSAAFAQPSVPNDTDTDTIPSGKVKAARPRGGGIDRDEVKSRRDYRRFSATTMPPEHQPSYQPKHATELPTHEHPSGSAVGVGSLPGNYNEFGVARLPDERFSKLMDERGNSPLVYSHKTAFETVFTPHTGQPFKSMLKLQGMGMRAPAEPESGRGAESGMGMGWKEANQERDREMKDSGNGEGVPLLESELPTKEVPSGSRVGVGSLPGPNTESGVATLPEERDGGKPCGSGYTGFEGYSAAEAAKRQRQRRLSTEEKVERYFEDGDHRAQLKVDLPSREEPSGSRVGVGSLPGPNWEAGVAVLPDERAGECVCLLGEAKKRKGTKSMKPTKDTEQRKHDAKAKQEGEIMRQEANAQLNEGKQDEKKSWGVWPFEDKVYIPECWGYCPAGGLQAKTKREMKEVKEEEDTRKKLSNHEKVVGYFSKVDCYEVMPKVDMPTKEEQSGSYGGVGSLPGPKHEVGVAVLPEERRRRMCNEVHPTLFMPSSEDQMPSSVGGVGTLPGHRSERGVALLPEERLFPADDILNSHLPPRMDQLPSREHLSGSVVGVGSLPGKRGEQGVVLLPEERLHPADKILNSHLPPRMDQMPSRERVSGSIVGVGSLPGQRTEKGVALTPEERHNPADQILMRKDRARHQQQQGFPGRGGHRKSRRRSEGHTVLAQSSGVRAMSTDGGMRRRQASRDDEDQSTRGGEDGSGDGTQHHGDTWLRRESKRLASIFAQQEHEQSHFPEGAGGTQEVKRHVPPAPAPAMQKHHALSPAAMEIERQRAERAFAFARRTADIGRHER
ncbi:hypothetical protein NMY22_g4097 [Coprinellus aureogranulatus]|nr:hypothetical protein NMY22_g4097 [Coprinellus aureogranulatus]